MDVKMPSAVRGSDSISAEFPSSNKEKQRTPVMEILFYSSIFSQVLLPRKYIEGVPVPTSIFKQRPLMYEAFVISNIFTFICAFSWLLIRNKPKLAKLSCFYFVVSVVSAAISLSIIVGTLALPV
ncbi:Na(+)-translocating NADH-quinone reductase subunit D (Na(+)-NQR subunit D) like [Melia azedarach]|uniref:Na(+)-translocating NADH-quinone reductase subunit D (Na(+)-NQR subunit D) like n=1 Tax=Melia azedarach TaxID=155640 RepID=A0ACC1YJ25_MELAZ|nr:Na(+)-translocating NADH-quinone reductase subunit D (Na(+)-NQR subunit D) like [Melia azedarach]